MNFKCIVKLFINIIFISSIIQISGCVTISNVPVGAEITLSNSEGLVVIGARPGTTLIIHSGTIREGRFYVDGAPEGIVGESENGYLVSKLKSTKENQAYGLVTIKRNIFFTTDCEQSLAAFKVRPGEIQYISDFEFIGYESVIAVQNKNLIDSARSYMAKSFPLKDKKPVQNDVFALLQGKCERWGVGRPILKYFSIGL